MQPTLLWYDLETFGADPSIDKIAQFACVRTGEDFIPLEEPKVFYCRIPPDYLPDPQSILITGITPQYTLERGMSERDFVIAVDEQLSRPGTCTVGYNSIRFDDEFIRYLYYRNFYDPYAREWQNGNSRWDLIDLVRAAHDLRPEGINWPVSEQGRPVFRLETLSEANGIQHVRAHDALSDVFATIELAKLIYKHQPNLFKWFFNHRRKKDISPLLDLRREDPLVHTSVMFTREEGCSTLVYPITIDTSNPNKVIAYDLRYSPELLLNLPPAEIQERVFISREQISDEHQRIHLKGIHVNKCPFIAPLSVLDEESARRLNIDVALCFKHLQQLRRDSSLPGKVRDVFDTAFPSTVPRDPEMALYSGFPGKEDTKIFQEIRKRDGVLLTKMQPLFKESRFTELFYRYIGRNFSEQWDDESKIEWKKYCGKKLLMPLDSKMMDIGTFKKRIRLYLEQKDTKQGDLVIMKSLLDYANWLEREYVRGG